MKYIFSILFCTLFLSGCSFFSSPSKTTFSDYIPKKIPEISESKPSQDWEDFVSKNFPENCDWENLNRVVDGDTIVVNENERIRFVGIDTPETKHPSKPIQPFGIESSKKTQEFLSGFEKVCLIEDSQGDSYDKYARKLAYVFSEKGTDVNAELLRLGLAKAYVRFSFERKAEFVFLESEAKKQRVGMWE